MKLGNLFYCTPDRSLDRIYLRTCAVYRLLKSGKVNKAQALEIANRRIRGVHNPKDRLKGTIEIWLAGPLRAQQNVETATANAPLFAEVAAHNLRVIVSRRRGGSWDAPENQYRNAWAELEAAK